MSEPRTEAGRRLLDFIAEARFVTNPEHDECHLAALGMVAGIPGILAIEAEATVVREEDCHCAERNVTHGRGCPCGNLARQPEDQP